MDWTTSLGALGPDAGTPVAAPAGAPMQLSGAMPAPGAGGTGGGQQNYSALMQMAMKMLAPPQNPGMQPMQMAQPLGMLNRSY